MDNRDFPDYFVAFVIYHEMLHHVYPAYVDDTGQKHIHTKAFKEQERQFKRFQEAQKWIHDNQAYLFNASH